MISKRLLSNLPVFTKHQADSCRSFAFFPKLRTNDDSFADQVLNSDIDYQEYSKNCFDLKSSRNCFIIQPYVKWGAKKQQDITPSEQLTEAEALIRTLPSWTVEGTTTVPLETLDKNFLFGSGTLEKLRGIIRKDGRINSVFINKGSLRNTQVKNLTSEFSVPILDRYRVVMQILKIHATSKHAKLQVALAELYYLWRTGPKGGNSDGIKMMFQSREQKLKKAIAELRQQRAVLRSNRQKNDFPVVAVVGYTNSGKTSLIKTLTGEDKLKPRDQLFATLDVTMHSGILPSGLEVLYVDTVGFISDIPTNLIECFVATLEDAVLADVVLHVEDISTSWFDFKRKHVLKTLNELSEQTGGLDIKRKLISVGNKCDLVQAEQEIDILKVSAKTDVGVDVLRLELEKKLLEVTNRRKLKIRVPNGGDEIRWLYKNATVTSEQPDQKDSQFMVATVIITKKKLEQFKHFCKINS